MLGTLLFKHSWGGVVAEACFNFIQLNSVGENTGRSVAPISKSHQHHLNSTNKGKQVPASASFQSL